MKYVLLLLIITFISCNANVPVKQKKKSIAGTSTVLAAGDYEQRKLRCNSLYARYNQTKKKADKHHLQRYFADSLLPCWYGTLWDYNGTALMPSEGKIACGYFITTTLQHTGMHVTRIKMAQCPSSVLIRTVCSDIRTYRNKPLEDLISQVKKDGTGLYIAGLDFHTGFIWYNGTEVYFIHASFYASKCVVKEKAADCAVLKSSRLKMTGKVNFTQ